MDDDLESLSDDDLEALATAGGPDPEHPCPKCEATPWAPGDGSDRFCRSCGWTWSLGIPDSGRYGERFNRRVGPYVLLDEDVAGLCAALGQEPLFHMSLGSKELFHSNFLAWFIDQFPDCASDALSSWTEPSNTTYGRATEREVDNLDLIVHLDRRLPIAIENKVFSVPDESQLDRYEGSIRAREATGESYKQVLLSLTSPGWDQDRYRGWQLRTYRELGAALRSQVPCVHWTDPFAAELLEHYLRLIDLLSSLVEKLGAPDADAPLLLPATLIDRLDTIRISAAIQKARASYVARALGQQVRQKWSDIEVDHDFTNGTSLLEAFRELPSVGDVPGDRVGWQLQGTQFRLAVITGGFLGVEKRAERERYVTERYGAWFDFDPLEEVIGVPAVARPTEVRGGHWSFQSYSPNFVYRYRSSPNLTPEQIIALGMTYLEIAEALH